MLPSLLWSIRGNWPEGEIGFSPQDNGYFSSYFRGTIFVRFRVLIRANFLRAMGVQFSALPSDSGLACTAQHCI